MFNKTFNIYNFIAAIIFLFIFTNSTIADTYPNTSIGVLDLNKVLLDAKAAKRAAEEIDKIAQEIEKELIELDEKMINE